MEMDALTKFAPSYFEYMRQGISSQVSGSPRLRQHHVSHCCPYVAAHCAGEDLRLLQNRLSQCHHGQGHEDERTFDGEPLLRKAL